MSSKLLEKISSRGYWEVNIRPKDFNLTTADIGILFPLVREKAVKIRGWDFPHIDLNRPPQIGYNWVGQETEWQHHLNSWRLYQSGLFINVSGMWIDWRDQSSFGPANPDWKPSALIGVSDCVFLYDEVFEFAARLSLSEVGSDTMYISINASGINGRRLYIDDVPDFGILQPYTASIKEFPFSVELSQSELVANPKELSILAVSELFKRFGWNTGLDNLRAFRERIFKR